MTRAKANNDGIFQVTDGDEIDTYIALTEETLEIDEEGTLKDAAEALDFEQDEDGNWIKSY